MSFAMLYLTLFLLSFGAYFGVKYSIKGLEKVGVFDDGFETRYTPPTKKTYVGFAVTSAVLLVIFAVIIF